MDFGFFSLVFSLIFEILTKCCIVTCPIHCIQLKWTYQFLFCVNWMNHQNSISPIKFIDIIFVCSQLNVDWTCFHCCCLNFTIFFLFFLISLKSQNTHKIGEIFLMIESQFSSLFSFHFHVLRIANCRNYQDCKSVYLLIVL